jgi:DNA-binding beta-propeller fold protein YncE
VQWVDDGPRSQSIYANVTADDQTLFVSDESAQSITVIDLSRARSIGRNSGKPVPSGESGNVSEAIVGKIAVGLAPVALTFSEDGSRLFACSEIAPPAWNWPLALERENRRAGREKVPEGAVSIIDVAIARTNPPASEVAHVPAGGSPVRSALSPDGRRLFVSARNSNAVLVFDTDQLVKDPVHARPEKVPVGASPVPVVLVRNGKWAVVGNSNRFSTNVVVNSSLTVLDTALIGTGRDPKIGTIACGAFPREFHLSADGKTLYLTNFRSDTLQVMEVARLEQLFEPSNR